MFPSEIARLVLGYLKEEKCYETYNHFLEECEHLQEYTRLMKQGYLYPTRLHGKSLKDFLQQGAPRKLQVEPPAKSENTHNLLHEQQYEQMARFDQTGSYLVQDMTKPKERSPNNSLSELMQEYRSKRRWAALNTKTRHITHIDHTSSKHKDASLSSSLQSHVAITDLDSDFDVEAGSSPSTSSITSYILPPGTQDVMYLSGRGRVASTPSQPGTADLNDNSVRTLFSPRETHSLVSSCETSPVSLDRVSVVPHPADHSSHTARPPGKSSDLQERHLPDNAGLTPDRSDVDGTGSGVTATSERSRNKTPTSVVNTVPTESDAITSLLPRHIAGVNIDNVHPETTSASVLDCNSNLGNSTILCLPDLLYTQDSMDPTTPVKNHLTAQTTNFLRTSKRKCAAPKRRSTGGQPGDFKQTTGLIEDSTDSAGFAVPIPVIQDLISCKIPTVEMFVGHINKGVQTTKNTTQKKAPSSSTKDDRMNNSSDCVKHSSEKQTVLGNASQKEAITNTTVQREATQRKNTQNEENLVDQAVEMTDGLTNPSSPEYGGLVDTTMMPEMIAEVLGLVRAEPQFDLHQHLFDLDGIDNARISTEHGTPSKQKSPGFNNTRPFSVLSISESRNNHPDIPPPGMNRSKTPGEKESVVDIEMSEGGAENVIPSLSTQDAIRAVVKQNMINSEEYSDIHNQREEDNPNLIERGPLTIHGNEKTQPVGKGTQKKSRRKANKKRTGGRVRNKRDSSPPVKVPPVLVPKLQPIILTPRPLLPFNQHSGIYLKPEGQRLVIGMGQNVRPTFQQQRFFIPGNLNQESIISNLQPTLQLQNTPYQTRFGNSLNLGVTPSQQVGMGQETGNLTPSVALQKPTDQNVVPSPVISCPLVSGTSNTPVQMATANWAESYRRKQLSTMLLSTGTTNVGPPSLHPVDSVGTGAANPSSSEVPRITAPISSADDILNFCSEFLNEETTTASQSPVYASSSIQTTISSQSAVSVSNSIINPKSSVQSAISGYSSIIKPNWRTVVGAVGTESLTFTTNTTTVNTPSRTSFQTFTSATTASEPEQTLPDSETAVSHLNTSIEVTSPGPDVAYSDVATPDPGDNLYIAETPSSVNIASPADLNKPCRTDDINTLEMKTPPPSRNNPSSLSIDNEINSSDPSCLSVENEMNSSDLISETLGEETRNKHESSQVDHLETKHSRETPVETTEPPVSLSKAQKPVLPANDANTSVLPTSIHEAENVDSSNGKLANKIPQSNSSEVSKNVEISNSTSSNRTAEEQATHNGGSHNTVADSLHNTDTNKNSQRDIINQGDTPNRVSVLDQSHTPGNEARPMCSTVSEMRINTQRVDATDKPVPDCSVTKSSETEPQVSTSSSRLQGEAMTTLNVKEAKLGIRRRRRSSCARTSCVFDQSSGQFQLTLREGDRVMVRTFCRKASPRISPAKKSIPDSPKKQTLNNNTPLSEIPRGFNTPLTHKDQSSTIPTTNSLDNTRCTNTVSATSSATVVPSTGTKISTSVGDKTAQSPLNCSANSPVPSAISSVSSVLSPVIVTTDAQYSSVSSTAATALVYTSVTSTAATGPEYTSVTSTHQDVIASASVSKVTTTVAVPMSASSSTKSTAGNKRRVALTTVELFKVPSPGWRGAVRSPKPFDVSSVSQKTSRQSGLVASATESRTVTSRSVSQSPTTVTSVSCEVRHTNSTNTARVASKAAAFKSRTKHQDSKIDSTPSHRITRSEAKRARNLEKKPSNEVNNDLSKLPHTSLTDTSPTRSEPRKRLQSIGNSAHGKETHSGDNTKHIGPSVQHTSLLDPSALTRSNTQLEHSDNNTSFIRKPRDTMEKGATNNYSDKTLPTDPLLPMNPSSIELHSGSRYSQHFISKPPLDKSVSGDYIQPTKLPSVDIFMQKQHNIQVPTQVNVSFNLELVNQTLDNQRSGETDSSNSNTDIPLKKRLRKPSVSEGPSQSGCGLENPQRESDRGTPSNKREKAKSRSAEKKDSSLSSPGTEVSLRNDNSPIASHSGRSNSVLLESPLSASGDTTESSNDTSSSSLTQTSDSNSPKVSSWTCKEPGWRKGTPVVLPPRESKPVTGDRKGSSIALMLSHTAKSESKVKNIEDTSKTKSVSPKKGTPKSNSKAVLLKRKQSQKKRSNSKEKSNIYGTKSQNESAESATSKITNTSRSTKAASSVTAVQPFSGDTDTEFVKIDPLLKYKASPDKHGKAMSQVPHRQPSLFCHEVLSSGQSTRKIRQIMKLQSARVNLPKSKVSRLSITGELVKPLSSTNLGNSEDFVPHSKVLSMKFGGGTHIRALAFESPEKNVKDSAIDHSSNIIQPASSLSNVAYTPVIANTLRKTTKRVRKKANDLKTSAGANDKNTNSPLEKNRKPTRKKKPTGIKQQIENNGKGEACSDVMGQSDTTNKPPIRQRKRNNSKHERDKIQNIVKTPKGNSSKGKKSPTLKSPKSASKDAGATELATPRKSRARKASNASKGESATRSASKRSRGARKKSQSLGGGESPQSAPVRKRQRNTSWRNSTASPTKSVPNKPHNKLEMSDDFIVGESLPECIGIRRGQSNISENEVLTNLPRSHSFEKLIGLPTNNLEISQRSCLGDQAASVAADALSLHPSKTCRVKPLPVTDVDAEAAEALMDFASHAVISPKKPYKPGLSQELPEIGQSSMLPPTQKTSDALLPSEIANSAAGLPVYGKPGLVRKSSEIIHSSLVPRPDTVGSRETESVRKSAARIESNKTGRDHQALMGNRSVSSDVISSSKLAVINQTGLSQVAQRENLVGLASQKKKNSNIILSNSATDNVRVANGIAETSLRATFQDVMTSSTTSHYRDENRLPATSEKVSSSISLASPSTSNQLLRTPHKLSSSLSKMISLASPPRPTPLLKSPERVSGSLDNIVSIPSPVRLLKTPQKMSGGQVRHFSTSPGRSHSLTRLLQQSSKKLQPQESMLESEVMTSRADHVTPGRKRKGPDEATPDGRPPQKKAKKSKPREKSLKNLQLMDVEKFLSKIHT